MSKRISLISALALMGTSVSLSKPAKTKRLVAILLAAIAAVSTGCSDSAEIPVVGDEGTSPLALRVFNESSASSTAAFGGTVLLQGGCVALESEGSIYTIVWLDERTTWDPDSQRVTMRRSGGRDDLVATVGEFEELGGQLIDEDWGSLDWIDWAVKPGPECPRKIAVI